MSKQVEGCPQPETPIRERAWTDEQRQTLPAGWRIEVRENDGLRALCVFGPIGCFAVDKTTDFASDIRGEVIDSLHIAMQGATP